MSPRPAVLTQADVTRAIRAAKKAGAGVVEILPDGTIRVLLAPVPTINDAPGVAEQAEVIVL